MTEPTQTEKPSQLPELRKGLTISFSDYDLDGKPQWLIYDAGRNKFFIIGWVEHEILIRWDLNNPLKIIEAVNSETTLHIDASDIESLIKFLSRNFLFKLSSYQIYSTAKEQQLFRNDNILHLIINYYLFFRIPLIHPDRFLVRTKAVAGVIFNRYLFYFMCILGIVAIYQINVQWEEFTHAFHTIISWQGFFLYMIVFVICKLFHELAHAYMCRSYGVPVPTLGVAFLVFFPVLYTDTTLSWSLNSKQRMRIALAGMWIETYIAIIAALIWANSNNPTLQTICYIVVAVNWIASLLVNVSPFMRFDGYYVLADFLKMPNLQPRSFALARWAIRRTLFGWDDPPPEYFSKKLHYLLVSYAITTWLYRLSLYIGIALLVYHFMVKAVGIILFIIELYYFILGPFIHEIRLWLVCRDKFILNTNTIVTSTVASMMVIAFFLPISQSIELPATMSYKHRFLVAPEESIVESNPPIVGALIGANQPIIVLSSDKLNHALISSYLDYNESITELRRASIDPSYVHTKDVLRSAIGKEEAKYKKLYEEYNKLTLSVPFSSIVIDVAPGLAKGNYVMKNEWLGDVVIPASAYVEAFANQTDIGLLTKGIKGHFYPHDLSYGTVPVKLTTVEMLNSNEFSCDYSEEIKEPTKAENMVVNTSCYNASELGGEIPTYSTEEGKYVPLDSTYRVILQPTVQPVFGQVLRGTVILKTQSRSYASRILYKVKKVLIEQSGF